jgi:CheY-like chemotaxis protein
VAKILVADDNSNIQKMVVLALKDQGIEVVAVGNGEAAVRKISDIKPDLVLADIFMPVRNGYEVCKFVKDNPALSHIPVILLVGAFDPLDEQEAQRVGADGVLKKPFVPPDPLISMVKSVLTRAGVALGAPAVPTPPPPIPVTAKSEPAPSPRVVPPPPIPAFAATPEEEFAAPAPPSRSNPFTIGKGAQPLAFGSLLDSSTSEDDAVLAISPTTHAAPDRDWGSSSAAADEDEAEEDSNHGGWRVSSLQETVDEVPAGQTDWREAAFSGIASEKAPTAGWAPSIEKNDLSITEEEAAALARNPADFSALSGSRGQEDWAKAIEAVIPENPQVARESTLPSVPELPEVSPPPPLPEPTATVAQPEIAGDKPDVNSWMAGAVSPWEAEMQRASRLTSTWDTAKSAPAVVVEEVSATEAFLDSESLTRAPEPPQTEEQLVAPSTPEPVSDEQTPPQPAIEAAATIASLLSPVTQEILHEEAAQAVAEQQPEFHESAAWATPISSSPAPASAPDMDEIVAKVLAKMNPEVLQAVTREILKPLVEAMIKDELHKS